MTENYEPDRPSRPAPRTTPSARPMFVCVPGPCVGGRCGDRGGRGRAAARRGRRPFALGFGVAGAGSVPVGVRGQTAVAHNNRGLSYYNQKDYDKALEEYDTAVRLDPTLAVVYSNRGMAYYQKGDYVTAVEDCSHAIRLNPADGPRLQQPRAELLPPKSIR